MTNRHVQEPPRNLERGDASIPYTEQAAPLESLIAGFHAAAVEAETGLWDVFELAMRTSDTLSHLRALDWLKPDTPHIWSLGNSPECRRAVRDGSLKPAAVPRMGTWGIAQGGWCLTQMVKPEPGVGEGCSLAEILVPDAPERYFLPEKQVAKLLYRAASSAPEDTAGDTDSK